MSGVECLFLEDGKNKVGIVNAQDFDPRIHTRLDVEREIASSIPEILCVELTANGIRTFDDLSPLVGGVDPIEGEDPAELYRRALVLGGVGDLAAVPAGRELARSPLAVALISRGVGLLRAAAATHGATEPHLATVAMGEVATVAPEGDGPASGSRVRFPPGLVVDTFEPDSIGRQRGRRTTP